MADRPLNANEKACGEKLLRVQITEETVAEQKRVWSVGHATSRHSFISTPLTAMGLGIRACKACFASAIEYVLVFSTPDRGVHVGASGASTAPTVETRGT